MSNTTTHNKVREKIFKDFPISTDFEENEVIVIFNKSREEYSFHKYIGVYMLSPIILNFEKLETQTTGLWSNCGDTSYLMWCRMNKLPIIEKTLPIKYVSRFELMDLD